MTDNKTTPEQFIKEWLPEYEQRLSDYTREVVGASSDIGLPYVAEVEFESMHFVEALEAFKRHAQKEAWDQACGETKRECAKHLTGYDGEHEPDELSAKIITTPAPEFKTPEKE